PPEELYDLSSDPDEVHNLAGPPAHEEARARMYQMLRDKLIEIRDVGFLPEGEMHRRSADSTPYDMGHDPAKYQVERLIEIAEFASSLSPGLSTEGALNDNDCAMRWWAVLGIRIRGTLGDSRDGLFKALGDSSPDVRVAAAATLGLYGSPSVLQPALDVLADSADWNKHDVFTVMAALNAIDALGEKATSLKPLIAKLPKKGPVPDKRYEGYPARLIADILGEKVVDDDDKPEPPASKKPKAKKLK
ncbi:MAG TPA: HEAT repeat domain-containing protein, partial [Pirellulales bacterium]|nr:HEAT repeat domain-containing protein [Pirellulales bacterium]